VIEEGFSACRGYVSGETSMYGRSSTVQYNAIQDNTMQSIRVQYSTVQCSRIQVGRRRVRIEKKNKLSRRDGGVTIDIDRYSKQYILLNSGQHGPRSAPDSVQRV
jgi:hypothetical protein